VGFNSNRAKRFFKIIMTTILTGYSEKCGFSRERWQNHPEASRVPGSKSFQRALFHALAVRVGIQADQIQVATGEFFAQVALPIRQDFYAIMCMTNLPSAAYWAAEATVANPDAIQPLPSSPSKGD
jgi:hypothetical protein